MTFVCDICNESFSRKDSLTRHKANKKIHIKQMKDVKLTYNDNNIIWKGKKYPLKYNKNSPWEKEAYGKEN